MIRFFIKDNAVAFSVKIDKFLDLDAIGADTDSYIDLDTDHPRWEYNGTELVEISLEDAMASVQS